MVTMTANTCAYRASSPGIGGASARTAGNVSTKDSRRDRNHFLLPLAAFGNFLMVLQSMVFILPSYSSSGYIMICRSSGWIAFRSWDVSSMKIRGAMKPVLVEAGRLR